YPAGYSGGVAAGWPCLEIDHDLFDPGLQPSDLLDRVDHDPDLQRAAWLAARFGPGRYRRHFRRTGQFSDAERLVASVPAGVQPCPVQDLACDPPDPRRCDGGDAA